MESTAAGFTKMNEWVEVYHNRAVWQSYSERTVNN